MSMLQSIRRARLPTRAQQGLNLLANALQWQPLLVRKTPQTHSTGSREASTSSQHASHSHEKASACTSAKHKPVGMLAAHPRDPFLANVPLALLGLDEQLKHYRAVSVLSWGQVASDRCFASVFAPAPMLLLPSSHSNSDSTINDCSSSNRHGTGRRKKRPTTGQRSNGRMHQAAPTIAMSPIITKRMCIGSSHSGGSGGIGNSSNSSNSSSNNSGSNGGSWHMHQRNQTSTSLGWAGMSPQNNALPRLACQHSPLQPPSQVTAASPLQPQSQSSTGPSHVTPGGTTAQPAQQAFPQASQASQHAVSTAQHAEAPADTAPAKLDDVQQANRIESSQMPQKDAVQVGQDHCTLSGQKQPSCVAPQQAGPVSNSSQCVALESEEEEPVLEFPEDFLAWLRSADELDVLIKVLMALPKDVDFEDALAQYQMRLADQEEIEVYPVSWFYNTSGPGDEQRWIIKGNFLGIANYGPSITFEQGSPSDPLEYVPDESDSMELGAQQPKYMVDVGSTGHIIGQGAPMRMPTDRGSLVFGYWTLCPYG